LARLHADLGGKIIEARKEAERLAADIQHVEAVIRLFDPAYDMTRIAAKRRQRINPWFKRGTMFRHAIDVLKTAKGPLTVREIAIGVLASQGVADPDLKVVRDLEGGIRSCLRYKEGKTVVNVGQGMPARWTLTA
jgi:hypothetical protein